MESAIHDDFLQGSGVFRKTLKRVNIDPSQHSGIWKLILLLTGLSWLPLLILTIAEGNFADGNGLYFLKDYPIHIRLLLALPILILTKKTAGKALEEFNNYAQQALLKKENYEHEVVPLWQKMSRFANSHWSDAVILTLVVVFSIINSENKIHFLTSHSLHDTWFAQHTAEGWKATMAGWWFLFVSSVIFQYQLMRWVWKYAIWSWLLFKFSKTPLDLHPSHPDRACGLEMLVEVQRGFLPLFIAVSVTLSAAFCQRVDWKILPFATAQTDIAGYVVFIVLIVFLPLVFFMPKLIKAKKQALREYSVFSVKLSTQVRKQITRTDRQDVDLRQEFDLSTLADFADCYDVVKEIRPFPFSAKSLIAIGVAIGIPFIPVFLTQMSLKDLIERLAGFMM